MTNACNRPLVSDAQSERLAELFQRTFCAADVAETLPSFDAQTGAAETAAFLASTGRTVIGVRRNGRVAGYARAADLKAGSVGDAFLPFDDSTVLAANASLAETIKALDRQDFVFMRMLGEVTGEITRQVLQKPVVRMWLFGMITVLEMNIQRAIEVLFPADAWIPLVPEGRLEKARILQAERHRRGQSCSLLDCLQATDKGQILLKDEGMRTQLGFASKRQAGDLMGALESLRNSLAHSQEILPEHWPIIVSLSQRLDELVRAARLSRVLAARADGGLRSSRPDEATERPV